MTTTLHQLTLPLMYRQMETPQLLERIADRKKQLAAKTVILGHHYQQDDIIAFADIVGDSFHLSREAAKRIDVENIIFCGVHFMAESADILASPHQRVFLPDLGAGCSMADMAALEDVEDAWAAIESACADLPGFKLIPITYVNSSAAIKFFVGQRGGAVCTSSNCEKILRWALENTKTYKNTKIIFFPDQHLGRNTAYKMGYPLKSMITWDYRDTLRPGGVSTDDIRNATFILWKGHCSVHQLFKAEHADQAREKYPGIQVIVHPECCWELVQKADCAGSTEFIGNTIANSKLGSKWAVGTEIHMVSRMAKKFPDRQIISLNDCQCLCTTMYRIDPAHLLWLLDNLAEGRTVNQIKVEDHVKHWARVSLQRMLDITAGVPVAK